MDYGLLLLIAGCLGAGVAGGLLSAWSCHRRILAMEEGHKLIYGAYEDRLNQLAKIVMRQDKSEAAKVRWNGKKESEETLAQRLTQAAQLPPHLQAWDPRTWGKD